MKTITLSDEAYTRLKDWKGADRESFSQVVLKVVPSRGTLGQMLEDVQTLPPLTSSQAKVMDETVAWGRDPKRSDDPWTS